MFGNTDKSAAHKLSINEINILKILATKGSDELYGLEILTNLNEVLKASDVKSIRKMQYKTLYPTLNRLVNKELISWRWGDADEQTGGARRKYYRISDSGKEVLLEQDKFHQAIIELFGEIVVV